MDAHERPTLVQSTPQAPQWLALLRVSVHDPLQHTCHMVDPQCVPFDTERVQLRLSVEAWLAHAPAAHRRSVRVRVCVPVVSHAFANPPHDDHDEYVVVPHASPAVVRLHVSDSIVVSVVHAPDTQRGVMTLRDRVPLSSHVFAKPPHADHAPVDGVPQSGSVAHASHAIVVSLQNDGQGGVG